MDIGIMQTSSDRLIDALMDEKDRLETFIAGYTAAKDRLKKIDECLLVLSVGKQSRHRKRQDGTIYSTVSRILRDAGPAGVTARQVGEELRKTHPDCSIAAASQVLTTKKQAGEVLHIGKVWMYSTMSESV